jgi:tRNA threonylcarbamoyladenosine biosynthesis protein TsaE
LQNFQITTSHPSETLALGKKFGEIVQRGTVILLNGPLGAGKTCFAQGLAAGLGVPKTHPVTSPSYSLMNIHCGRLPLYHFDLYRLRELEDLDELGYDEFAEGSGVAVIEWAERIDLLSEASLEVAIECLDENRRRFTFVAYDDRGRQLLELIAV